MSILRQKWTPQRANNMIATTKSYQAESHAYGPTINSKCTGGGCPALAEWLGTGRAHAAGAPTASSAPPGARGWPWCIGAGALTGKEEETTRPEEGVIGRRLSWGVSSPFREKFPVLLFRPGCVDALPLLLPGSLWSVRCGHREGCKTDEGKSKGYYPPWSRRQEAWPPPWATW